MISVKQMYLIAGVGKLGTRKQRAIRYCNNIVGPRPIPT